ncbi:MAG TPA: DUF4373 domain-containing protein [Cyclobacteriaceae bacterium]|nr:DUF4373 domain-containing protein [Cyclobacteriaceae bacterium]
MARPVKEGVDYFPLDVNMDTKFELIEAKHGVVGFAIIIKLLQKIYSEGYYIMWSEEMSLLFSKRNNVDINSINVIINDAVRYGIFEKYLFEHENVLTSKGIQRRYLDITKRRRVDVASMPYIIVNNNPVNNDNNSENVSENTTKKSKEKKSKEKESKVKESKELDTHTIAREAKIEILKIFEKKGLDLAGGEEEFEKFCAFFDQRDWITADGVRVRDPVALARTWTIKQNKINNNTNQNSNGRATEIRGTGGRQQRDSAAIIAAADAIIERGFGKG